MTHQHPNQPQQPGRSRRGRKIAIGVAATVVGLGLIGALGSGGDDDDVEAATDPGQTEEEDATDRDSDNGEAGSDDEGADAAEDDGGSSREELDAVADDLQASIDEDGLPETVAVTSEDGEVLVVIDLQYDPIQDDPQWYENTAAFTHALASGEVDEPVAVRLVSEIEDDEYIWWGTHGAGGWSDGPGMELIQ